MNKDSNNIKNYSAEDIRRYWNNEMSAAEMHGLEKAAMDDPFLADALEGFSKLQKNPSEDLAVLKSKLKARATTAATVVTMKRNNTWLKVAAAVIIIGGAGILTLTTMNDHKNEVAKNQPSHDSSIPVPAASAQTKPLDSSQYLSPAPSDLASKPSGNRGEDRKAVVTNHLQDKLREKDSVPSFAKQEYNYTTEEKKTAAPSAAIPKKDNDDRGRTEERQATTLKAEFNKEAAGIAAPSPSSFNSFSGKVINAQNQVVPNASVVMNNTRSATLTDQNGFFQFLSKDTVANISIASPGYQNVNLQLSSNQSGLITLDKQNDALQEVVVEGYAKSSKKKAQREADQENKNLKIYVMDAEPVVGWEKYNQYIDSNKRIPQTQTLQKGEVVLSFKVSKDGDLSSFNVEQSLSKSYDNEAIRLVKEGPAWKVTKGKKARVKLIVHF